MIGLEVWIIGGMIAVAALSFGGLAVAFIGRRKALAEMARQMGFEFAEVGTPHAFRSFDLHVTPEQRRQLVEEALLRFENDNPAIKVLLRNQVEKALAREPEPIALTSLRSFELMLRGSSRSTENVMTGHRDGFEVVVFDFSYRIGQIDTSTRTQTVVAVRLPGAISAEPRLFKHAGRTVETNGDALILYKPYRRLSAKRIPQLIEQALTIARG